MGRECYLRASGRILVVEVLGISGDTVWVSCPSTDTFSEGTGVELEFHDRDSTVGYHARVAVVPRYPGNGLMIERSETASQRPGRRYWRVPTDLSVWVRIPGTRKKLKGRMLDLAQNGALVETSAPLVAGEMLELVFKLPEFVAHDLVAQVVYSDKAVSNGANCFGLRFVEVKRRARDAITWFLYDRVHELYPDELRELYPPAISKSAEFQGTGGRRASVL